MPLMGVRLETGWHTEGLVELEEVKIILDLLTYCVHAVLVVVLCYGFKEKT